MPFLYYTNWRMQMLNEMMVQRLLFCERNLCKELTYAKLYSGKPLL